MADMQAAILALVKRCAVDLPADVERALVSAAGSEAAGTPARQCLETILANVRLARERQAPLCQDTGVPLFFVTMPDGRPAAPVREAIHAALRAATGEGFLRPNVAEPLSGANSGDNTGWGLPPVKFDAWDRDLVRITLLLKGGGSENVSAQFKLPDAALGAQRDLEGVRRVVLRAVCDAEGKGCAPGIIGVGIGGDRELAWAVAKKQLLRPLDDAAGDPGLARLETGLGAALNTLGIGPMGLGGRTTVLGVKAGAAGRHPASFFVSVAYLCWAARRYTIEIRPDGGWAYAG